MTWKEPHRARQERIKISPEFQPKNLLRKALACLLIGPLLMGFVFTLQFISRPQFAQQNLDADGWYLHVRNFLCFSALFSLFLLAFLGLTLLDNCFEAKYRLDDKGLRIEGAILGRSVLWRYVTHLEVIPHPTLENIALLRFISFSLNQKSIEEIPFESGQIDTATAMELYKKHGGNKKCL